MGYRLRRNYGYLFGVVLLSWMLKLQVHPEPAADLAGALYRAAVGLVPASTVLMLVAVLSVVTVGLILTAPSERMMDWEEIGSPWGRLASWGVFGSRGSGEKEGD